MTTWDDLFTPGQAEDFFDPVPPPFNPGAGGFDANNARWLMELCRLVYREDGRERFLARAGLRELLNVHGQPHALGPDTHGYVVEHESREWAALVFRGSASPMNWLTNAQFAMEPWREGGRAHHGFQDAINAVWNDDLTRLLDRLHCPVFYAGHSLGAALATLAASLRRPAAVYTFGSPLVGDRDFTATITSPVFRVVDHDDIVAHVPPPNPLLRYVHVGELRALNHVAERPDDFGLLPLIAHFIGDPAHWLNDLRILPGVPDPLADHAPINYVRRIR